MAAAAGTTTTKPKKPSDDVVLVDEGAICCGLVIIVLAIIGAVHLFINVAHWHLGPRMFSHAPVEYNLTIAAVSGLDPAKDLQADDLLHPAFNLTLLVASPRKAERRECVKPGTTVEVSYLRSGVPLATGPAPTFCVDVGERREEGSIIAWGDGVRLPELLLDSLAVDMRRGAPEFGVKLTPLPDCSSGERFCYDTMDVISCWVKVGSGPAPCSVSEERVSFPPVPRRPGVKDSVSAAAANLPQPPTP